MKVKDLIKELEQMPQNAEVFHLWDGVPRTVINIVYLSKKGEVITSDFEQVCYCSDSRPIDAPTSIEDRFWHTPLNPDKEEE